MAVVTPKIGDFVKEIRKFRGTVGEEEFMEMLKKKGAKILPGFTSKPVLISLPPHHLCLF